ncbi:MAG TPA: histidine kinase [Verrucomicrobiae bacterium]|jgi:signal transduction histidine kinase|nr:histidine kinase [Verrucomicrobiae bacterium]
MDRRSIAAQPLLVDALIAGGLTAVSLLAIFGGAGDVGGREPLSVGLLLLQTVPLVARRIAPLPVLAVTFGATFVHILIAFGHGSLNETLGALVALYTVAEQGDRRTSVPAAVVLGSSFAAVFYAAGVLPVGLQGLLQSELSVVLAWAFGDSARSRRLVASLLADRDRMIELEREERAARAVQAERERIARELHDVVTHHVSVVVIQAGAAQRALDKRPEQVRQALAAIEQTGRQALVDMRRMLGILGEPAAADDGGLTSGLEPMPGLDRIGELLERVRAAGLPVEVSITGEPRPLDAGVELSAYRIVQEALTNALKYARGARAKVVLRYAADAFEIEVVDAGGVAPAGIEASHDGRGLIGMRERVGLFGGRLEAGPTGDGFRVVAHMPLPVDGAAFAT